VIQNEKELAAAFGRRRACSSREQKTKRGIIESLDYSMQFPHFKVNRWFLIYILLCLFGVTAVFCFIQSDPIEFEDTDTTLVKLELSSCCSSPYIGPSSLGCLRYSYNFPYKPSVFFEGFYHDFSLIPALNDICLLGRSLGGCGS
jgi:hypothetical protein